MSISKIFPNQTGETLQANCTICGASYTINTNWNAREGDLCTQCNASGRSQAIAYIVSKHLFKNQLPLAQQKPNKKLRLIGLSDGQVYARHLEAICNYTNSFYHQKPYLDITSPPKNYLGKFDALISADVFEHVLAEPCHAFRGAYNILKPGGYLILTVPFVNIGEHKEHYPGISGYNSTETDNGWIVDIEYHNGKKSVDKNPKFHGGPGKTLEVRLFNRTRLMEELNWAGFDDVNIMDENLPKHGINWNVASRPIVARK